MSEIASRPYRPTDFACEACCLGSGNHAAWCDVTWCEQGMTAMDAERFFEVMAVGHEPLVTEPGNDHSR